MGVQREQGQGFDERTQRRTLLIVASVIFVDFAGFGLVLPLLPFWAERLGANAIGVGLAVTLYALAQFLFTPLLGRLSDRYGRRPIILYSLLVEALALALTALAGSLPLLLLARFVGGLGASNIGSAQAIVSDITPPERRARGMGLIGAAIGMGFVVGPALGGVLAAHGAATPFWVAMVVALLNAVLVARFLPETRRLAPARFVRVKRRNRRAVPPLTSVRRAFALPGVGRLIAVNALFTVAFTAMETAFPLFTQRAYGWTATQNGYIFTYVGVLVAAMQGGLVGRLVARFGEQRVLVGGLALLALGLALLPLGTSFGVLLLALGALSIGEGASTPTSSALLSFASPSGAQGETLGLAQGFGGLGRIVGPLLAGALFVLGPGAPFVMGGVLGALAVAVALPALPRHERPPSGGHRPLESAEPAHARAG